MVVTDYNEQFLDKRGTDHLIDELKAYIDGIATGDIDLSNYVTKSELQAKLDALDINIDLSSYATKEELTNAINSIDLSAYAKKTDIPSLEGYVTETELNAKGYLTEHQDLSAYALKTEIPSLNGYATTEYVDNAIANVPSGGTVDLSNYYTKAETDERDLMISPLNSLGEKYITDNMPNIKAYAGTNTITFEAGIDVRGGILVDGEAPYYFNNYSGIDSSKNSFTFEADREVIVKDYVFYFGESTDGLSNLTVTITNGSKSDVYSIPIYGDGTQEVYYRKIKHTPLYIKKTKFDFSNRILFPLNNQVYKNRDEITRLKESGISGKPGKDGKDGITPHIDSTTKHWMIGNTDTGVIAEGSDGVSPTVTVTKEGKIATITCTDVNGTTTATISDGADGQGGGTTDLSNYYTKSETYSKAEVDTLVANSGGSSGGGSSSGSGEVYSTEEIAIGKWIDGKTIYRKVISMDLPAVKSGQTHSAIAVVGNGTTPCNIMMLDWRAVSYSGLTGSDYDYPSKIIHGDGFKSAVVWTTKKNVGDLTQELCRDMLSVFHAGNPTSSYINCYYGSSFASRRCDFILDYLKVETT